LTHVALDLLTESVDGQVGGIVSKRFLDLLGDHFQTGQHVESEYDWPLGLPGRWVFHWLLDLPGCSGFANTVMYCVWGLTSSGRSVRQAQGPTVNQGRLPADPGQNSSDLVQFVVVVKGDAQADSKQYG